MEKVRLRSDVSYNYRELLEIHFTNKMIDATNRFDPEKLFTEGCSLSHYGKVWNVKCTIDFNSTATRIFLRLHAYNTIHGYIFSKKKRVGAVVAYPSLSIDTVDEGSPLDSFLISILENGQLSNEGAPKVSQCSISFVSKFFQKVPNLIPDHDAPPLPPKDVTVPSPLPSSYKRNMAKYFLLLVGLIGAVYLIFKSAKKVFTSLKGITLFLVQRKGPDF